MSNKCGMTPEQKKVIELAIYWHKMGSSSMRANVYLDDAVIELLKAENDNDGKWAPPN
jgi:hypothetical protein